MPHLHKLRDFYCFAAAIINRYLILMENATAELARESALKRVHWTRFEVNDAVPDFPVLELQYLRDITYGTY